MQINELNYDEKVASLIFSREEIHILRTALSEYKDKVSSEDNEWLHLQLVGVDDILKDGNFTRFFGYHMRLIELKGKYAHSTREAGTYKQFFEKMKSALERWYNQHSDKSYTETFYKQLIADTEELLWSNCER